MGRETGAHNNIKGQPDDVQYLYQSFTVKFYTLLKLRSRYEIEA